MLTGNACAAALPKANVFNGKSTVTDGAIAAGRLLTANAAVLACNGCDMNVVAYTTDSLLQVAAGTGAKQCCLCSTWTPTSSTMQMPLQLWAEGAQHAA